MGIIKKIINSITKPRAKYQPLIEVRIFKDALLHNLYTYQQKYPKLQFAPVLKSNAYGHGLVEVAEILDSQDLPFFMVDSFYEALVLRRAGIKSKVLVLGYCREKQLLENPLDNVSFGIIDLEVLKKLSAKLKEPLNIHLKIDTGMHRQGILVEEVEEAIKLIKANQNIILEGVCSHFADADGNSSAFTEKQIQQWNELVKVFKQQFQDIKYFHSANSAGAYYANKTDANICRLGIGLYGFNVFPHESLNLKPALEMRSIITSIKTIPEGEKLGYNITYAAPLQMKTATVPVGYDEGLDRRLSNNGWVKIDDMFCPIVGRVSMNMCSVDVTDVDVKIEDEVIVISSHREDKNSVKSVAKETGQTVYEILVKIPWYLKRIIT